MDVAVVALALVAFLLLFVPASLLPLLAGAAIGADTIDHLDRIALAEAEAGEAWDDDRIAA